MSKYRRMFVAALGLTTSLASTVNAQHPAMPPGMTHEEHLAQMQKDGELKKRGAAAMGFDQDKTSHHFRLTAAGGMIEVSVNDPSDETSRQQIRAHLKDIAGKFENGSFAKPFATHGEAPAGVHVMEQRKATIAYAYEDTPEGGRVRITTTDPQAKSGVHEFLRYQIREHATGDPLTVSKEGVSRRHDLARLNPSAFQPSMPPIIFLTGRPSRARRIAALSAPLQCGPEQ